MLKICLPTFAVVVFTVTQISGSALFGPCTSNDECGTFDTHCKNGTCVCLDHFVVMYDSCVPVVLPHVPCKRRDDCHATVGDRSTCKDSKCVCKPFHHLHRRQCVKNKDLNDVCHHDSQCYCGKDCAERIACIKHVCKCKMGFKPYSSRRCTIDPTWFIFSSTTTKPKILQSASTSNSFNRVNLSTMYLTLLYIFIQ